VKVTQDYIKVTLTMSSGETVHEAHVYPVRDLQKHPKRYPNRDPKKENESLSNNILLLFNFNFNF